MRRIVSLLRQGLSLLVNTVAGLVAVPGAHAIVDLGPRDGRRGTRRRQRRG